MSQPTRGRTYFISIILILNQVRDRMNKTKSEMEQTKYLPNCSVESRAASDAESIFVVVFEQQIKRQ